MILGRLVNYGCTCLSKEDSVRLYFISADDVERIERLGDARTVDERIFILH